MKNKEENVENPEIKDDATKEGAENPTSAPEPTPNPDENPEPKEDKKGKGKTAKAPAKAATVEISPVVDRVLKLHPEYEKLYVDAIGCCFTEGTPEMIRKGAVLYTNKYFQK